jgi:hypothetical protein
MNTGFNKTFPKASSSINSHMQQLHHGTQGITRSKPKETQMLKRKGWFSSYLKQSTLEKLRLLFDLGLIDYCDDEEQERRRLEYCCCRFYLKHREILSLL